MLRKIVNSERQKKKEKRIKSFRSIDIALQNRNKSVTSAAFVRFPQTRVIDIDSGNIENFTINIRFSSTTNNTSNIFCTVDVKLLLLNKTK